MCLCQCCLNCIYVLVSVCEMKNPTMSAFLQGLEASGWLKHIKAVVDTSVFIAEVGSTMLPFNPISNSLIYSSHQNESEQIELPVKNLKMVHISHCYFIVQDNSAVISDY